MDWLSSVRLHPVNDAVNKFALVLPLIALGFSPAATAGIAPFLALHAIMLHANLNWDFGPLRSVISSPVFHRWHHTKEAEALDKNFGGLLPVWDILFGTYHMPRGKTPTVFGTDDKVPDTVGAQLVYAFRRAKDLEAAGHRVQHWECETSNNDVLDKGTTTSRLPGEQGFKDARGSTLFPDLPGQSRDPIYNTTLPAKKE